MHGLDSTLITKDKSTKRDKESPNDRDDTENTQRCGRHLGRECLRSEVMNGKRIDAAEYEQAANYNIRSHHIGFVI